MRRFLILAFAILAVSARLPAQTGAVGKLTASSTNCLTTNACLEVNIPPTSGGATLKLSGTFSATVQFEATADPLTVLPSAANWVAISVTPSNSSTTATSATSTGAWQVNVSAYTRIRIRVSTYGSGTVAAAINLSTASARGGSGAGGGGAITGCTTSGGVLYQNGTSNTATCNAQFIYSPTGISFMESINGSDSGVYEINLATPGDPLLQFNASTTGLGAAMELDAASQLVHFGPGGNNYSTAIFAQAVGAGFPIASSGIYRLSKAGIINWRNNGNTADLGWSLSAADAMSTTAPICIAGTSSGQGCWSVEAAAANMTSSLPVATNGPTAGAFQCTQGSANGHATANTVTRECPASVTAYEEKISGTAPVIASYTQTDGCPSLVCTDTTHPVPVVLTVATDFTDSTSTTLLLVTGLSTTMPTSSAAVITFHCSLLFDQGSAAVSDSFGIGVTGTAPTSANARGVVNPSASTLTAGTLVSLASTTPTAVVTFTPSAITTVWGAELDGTIEQPSNATPGIFGVYVATTTGGDNFIVKRGSSCQVLYQ